jgi:mannitol/fructose-specific phosphotransferase system IIA component (Ntr-type)
MQIHNLLTSDRVAVGLDADTKEDAIFQIIDLFTDDSAITDLASVRNAVIERETTMSTGVGKGIVLPHGKSPAATATVAALATMAHPIPFGAVDGQPVRVVFLLVGTPESKSEHIKILSRISRLLSRESFAEELLKATTPDMLLETLTREELNLSSLN